MALQTKTLTANGSKGHHKFTLTVSEDSITTATNISTVSFTFKISPIVSGYNWISYGNIKYSINIGETPYSGTILNYDGSSTVTLKSGSLPITHDSNGDKTIDISFSVTDPNTSVSYTCGPASASGSMTLTKIARASSLSLSAASVDVGKSITANITPADTSFTHTVEFYINSSYSQSYTGISTSKAFTIPTSWYDYMSSSTSCTAYCRITTYSGSTQVGDQIVKSFTVNVPSSIKPNITANMITLTPAAVNGNNILIKGKNKLTISVSGCSAGTGSAIKSYTFSGPSISTTLTSASATTSTVSVTGTLTYTVTVTDTRGRTSSASQTITCYDYYAPSFTSFDVYRADSNGNTNINGTYLKCIYAINYASVNSTNSTTVTLKYTTGSTSKTATMSGGSALINLGNATSSYQVSATVTDSYGGSAPSSTLTIFGDARILNITSDGTGFAIGKMAESSNLFECRWDAKFDGSLDVNSNKITSVATPTANTDAANKKYVDDAKSTITLSSLGLTATAADINGGKIKYTAIPNNANVDDYRTPGFYRSSSASYTITNKPDDCSSAFELTVQSINNNGYYCSQLIKDHSKNAMWIRTQKSYNSLNWTEWEAFNIGDINLVTLLWSGSTNLSSSSVTVTNGYSGDYSLYVFVWDISLGSSKHHMMSQTIPKALISTTDIVIPFVSGSNYKYMNVKYSSNDLILSINATGGYGGDLRYVYGIK